MSTLYDDTASLNNPFSGEKGLNSGVCPNASVKIQFFEIIDKCLNDNYRYTAMRIADLKETKEQLTKMLENAKPTSYVNPTGNFHKFPVINHTPICENPVMINELNETLETSITNLVNRICHDKTRAKFQKHINTVEEIVNQSVYIWRIDSINIESQIRSEISSFINNGYEFNSTMINRCVDTQIMYHKRVNLMLRYAAVKDYLINNLPSYHPIIGLIASTFEPREDILLEFSHVHQSNINEALKSGNNENLRSAERTAIDDLYQRVKSIFTLEPSDVDSLTLLALKTLNRHPTIIQHKNEIITRESNIISVHVDTFPQNKAFKRACLRQIDRIIETRKTWLEFVKYIADGYGELLISESIARGDDVFTSKQSEFRFDIIRQCAIKYHNVGLNKLRGLKLTPPLYNFEILSLEQECKGIEMRIRDIEETGRTKLNIPPELIRIRERPLSFNSAMTAKRANIPEKEEKYAIFPTNRPIRIHTKHRHRPVFTTMPTKTVK